jgi:GDPmannose 4,6-dehydratase
MPTMKPKPKRVLIFGISGQDGAYLAQHFLKQGFEVHGTSRDHQVNPFTGLGRLGIRDAAILHSVTPSDFARVADVIQSTRPAYIFHFAGQSSVSLSFADPINSINSTTHGTINILEAIRTTGLETRFYNAASSECFGNTPAKPADEETPFRPRSPYAIGKVASFWAVANYREAHNLFACSGLSFNHESPLRPERYVTRKIVCGAADIAERKADRLALGNMEIVRDWGWAPEYVDAMARMLQLDRPEDFVIATGVSVSLREFVAEVFRAFGLDWTEYVEIDKKLTRPLEILESAANPAKAERLLGWRATTKMPKLVCKLVEGELAFRRSLRG